MISNFRILKFHTFNVIDSFLVAAFTVLVPLSLNARNIDLVSIGWIVALLPLIFTVSRVIFASIADGIGTKPFFIFNAAAGTVASFLYMNATNIVSYSAGRILEGLRGGAIWAVNRLEAMKLTQEKRVEDEFARLASTRLFAFGAGTIISGFVVFYIGFELTFMFLGILSFILFLLSFSLGTSRLFREDVNKIVERLDLRKKSARLWKMAIYMLPAMPATSLPLGFLLPLYLNKMNFNYSQIGVLIGAYYLISSFAFPITKKAGLPIKRLALLCFAFFSVGVLLLSFKKSIWLGVGMMAFGDGLGSILWERFIVKGTYRSKTAATDVGLLHVPAHLATTFFLAVSGYLVESLGFINSFYICALLMGIYCFFAAKELY
ncbi:MAG: MFS transporter [Candidatus Anstonellales archaeon]